MIIIASAKVQHHLFTQTNYILKNIFALFLLLFTIFIQATAQKNSIADKIHPVRCGTMEALEQYLQANPAARALSAQNKNRLPQASLPQNRTLATMTIPVVIHLVLSAQDLAKVTDADVAWQIHKLNEDYSGLNADSTNATSFYAVRGHSNIRFCLAAQDANGNPTNGIDRVVSSITDFNSNNVGLLKHAASCGANAWDPNRYLNIWISRSSSLLGISTFPAVGPDDEQGVAISLDGFSNNPAYVSPSFNNGRTLVHETGHYLGLYHIWGDEAGCTTSDFRQLPGSCIIAGSDIVGSETDITVGDTPNQGNATSGCPSGERLDACGSASPGIQYQNFMDYTDDGCYSMFTKLQVKRMEYVLQTCHASLLTSTVCGSVPILTNDAAITSIINPGSGSCSMNGSTTFCAGSSITPTVELKNLGAATLRTVKIIVQVDGITINTFNWSGALASFNQTLISLPAFTAPSVGLHNITVLTSDPNAQSDERTANDAMTKNFTVNFATNNNIHEDFETAMFPPDGWRLFNPDNSVTWIRFNGAGYNSVSSARINIYNYRVIAQTDILAAPPINIQNQDSLRVSFALSHAPYGNPGFGPDSLELVYSTDCGTTWKSFGNYKKWGNGNGVNALATTGATTIDFVPSSPTQWRLEKASLPLPLPGNPATLMIGFRSVSMYGNNIYLDNINIEKVVLVSRDAGLSRINNLTANVCQPNFTPQVTVANTGRDTLRSLAIRYRVDGGTLSTFNWAGTLLSGSTTTVTLSSINLGAVGNHLLTIYTDNPNGLSDQNPANDTLKFNYQVLPVITLAKVDEGFNSTVFPPAGWSINNPDNDFTWQRIATVGKAAKGAAWFNDYQNNTINRLDDLKTPNYTFSGTDSVFLTFQLSAVTYSYPGTTGVPLDTLSVLVSKDCGNTFTEVYKKWGEDLQTVGDPNYPHGTEFFPTKTTDWRRDSVNLGEVLNSSEPQFQVAFRLKGNYENNIFIDDVNLYTKVLPATLKDKGFLVLPTVTNGQFVVWHYQQPTNLRSITVVNTTGQIIWKKEYTGNADKFIPIDLSGKAAGLYTVLIAYTNKKEIISQKIVKY